MNEAGWIVIPRWNEFQHYKRRDPTWIKNQLALLHSDEYRELSYSQRGLLHCLWIEYATSHGQVRNNTRTLSRLLGQRVLRPTLDALNHAGFIEVSASKPLALRYQDASLEVEVEEENESAASNGLAKQPASGASSPLGTLVFPAPAATPGTPYRCERCIGGMTFKTATQLADHQANVHGVYDEVPQ